MTEPTPTSEIPDQGRLLGLDFGTKRIGAAISDADQRIASPLENYTRRDLQQDARRLLQWIDDYQVVGIVIGLPVHMSGDEGHIAGEARRFGQWVAETARLPVHYWDERFTSSIAEEYLQAAELSKKKRKARLDMLAAQIMLQSFLDASHRDSSPGAY